MTDKPKRHSQMMGNYTLADLLGKCRMDDETGCAVLAAGRPSVWIPVGVLGNETRWQMNAARAAWLLSGKTIEPGHQVYRAACTCRPGCILPKHGAAGTVRERWQVLARAGVLKGNARRIQANTLASKRAPVEVVQKIVAQLEAGASTREAAKACGVSQNLALRVMQGKHANDPRRLRCVANASIFTMARAA